MLPILTIQRKFPKQKQKTNRLELSTFEILLEIKTSSPYKKHPSRWQTRNAWRRNIPAAAIPKITLNEFQRSCAVSGIQLVRT